MVSERVKGSDKVAMVSFGFVFWEEDGRAMFKHLIPVPNTEPHTEYDFFDKTVELPM